MSQDDIEQEIAILESGDPGESSAQRRRLEAAIRLVRRAAYDREAAQRLRLLVTMTKRGDRTARAALSVVEAARDYLATQASSVVKRGTR